ncbi:SRPBCC family protein [Niveibacterium sp. SC-1]|uniref:SRPBCC family protein n=1 Tax=Niveibacterium sp. SC-1 TaxID=3135646 RepID=UPI00311FECAC
MHTPTLILAGALGLVGGGLSQGAGAALPESIANDLARRDADIHWPASHTPDTAVIFAHNEIAIAASCAQVWSHLVDAASWPAWYANASDIHIEGARDGLLAAQAVLRWTTFDLAVESRIHEFEPNARLGWFGKAEGVDAYHTWLLRPQGTQCVVVTEEVLRGEVAQSLLGSQPGALHDAHEQWLLGLKRRSESAG